MNLSNVAIPVFSEENYHAIMAALSDGERDRLPYDQYLMNAEAHEAELRETGVATRRIAVTPDALLFWCERHARPVSKESISLYAADQLAELLAGEAAGAPPPEPVG